MFSKIASVNFSERKKSVNRLAAFRGSYEASAVKVEKVTLDRGSNFFDKLCLHAGYQISSRFLLLSCLVAGLICFGIGLLISKVLALFLFFCGFYLPIAIALSKSKERSRKFSEEYPSVLLAMASNMKAGLTVYSSLERATIILPLESEVKKEVKLFLERISQGIPKDIAVEKFGSSVVLPELELFRRAFALVIVHGGKFSRTLERLAQVCRDRENLIKASTVSTASMRMTSNVLLVVAPLLLFILSLKNKDFWNVLLNNNTAYGVGLVGFLIIIVSVFALRTMSDFKP
jgi:Flp pilus assembly protein TadB